MLHYAVNRPLGALLGEGDLATLIPWLLRYSRMLEDLGRFLRRPAGPRIQTRPGFRRSS
jgi:hypothetical protein